MIGIYQNNKLDEQSLKQMHWENVKLLVDKDISIFIGGKAETHNLLEILDEIIAREFSFKTKRIANSFEEIVKLSFRDVRKLFFRKSFDNVNTQIKRICREKKTGGQAEISILREKYTEYRDQFGKDFVKHFELTVCPYCNREYINEGNGKTMAELDHFFSQTKYPLLALSFGNLVPCCHSCNHNKLEKNVKVSPQDRRKKTNEIIEFSYALKNTWDTPEIRVKGIGMYKDDMETNIKNFELRELYQVHINEIEALRIRVINDSSTYRDGIKNYYIEKGLPMPKSIEEIVFDTPLSEETYYQKPLSKFKRDIILQVKRELKHSLKPL